MPKGVKGFQKGHTPCGGRPKGSSEVRRKYLQVWEQVFEDTDPIAKLTKLTEENYPEFIRLGLAAMPKEAKVDINAVVDEFESWTDEELEHYIKTGHRPENE